MPLGEIGNAYGIVVERFWGAATRNTKKVVAEKQKEVSWENSA